MGEGLCNGKLRREKVVKRGRVVGKERNRVEVAGDLNIDVEEQ